MGVHAMTDAPHTTGYRFGKIWLRRDHVSLAIGPKRSHISFDVWFPRFTWGWYGGAGITAGGARN
jgi:hypothetical protein